MHPGITGRKPGQVDSDFIDDPIINEPALAKYIGVSVMTVRRMRWAGKIPYVQVSDNRVGYRRSTANKLLDARTVHATA